MAGQAVDSAKNMINSIGAIQTLVENFPMSLFSFRDIKLGCSFDLLSIIFKILGVEREELIKMVTDALTGSMKHDEDGTGFIAQAEEIVKMALEANIINVLNCATNPIISNDLLDNYVNLNTEYGGEGIVLDVSEINFTGVLNQNPYSETGSKFYFDLEDDDGQPYSVQNLYKSKDFNAFLWYIINKSDPSNNANGELIWDNRYRAAIYGKGNGEKKEIIKCTYLDEDYPMMDKIRVQLCGARNKQPANYFKTRKLSKKNGGEWALNKTIFEFNHEFLSSIKLYDPKVIVAEIVQYLLGEGNVTINLGLSVNEQIIEGKIQQIIKKIIEADDTVINDCYFSFSNDEYNEMLEKAELNRYNKLSANGEYISTNPTNVLSNLDGITNNSKLIDDKTIIENTLEELMVTPAKDGEVTVSYGIAYDWQFELMRMLVYPFVRPLFTPKVIFLLLVNKHIMGSLEDGIDFNIEDFISGLLNIVRDIVIKLKDLLVDMFLQYALKKLAPLLALFASRLLLETLIAYKDLLMLCLKACVIPIPRFGSGGSVIGSIDDVNYADIIPTQEIPDQSIC